MSDATEPRSTDPDPVSVTASLERVLERARTAGFLGDAPVADQVDHARALIRSIPDGVRTFVDLGSGGGVPGLVVAVDRPELHGALLDGSTRRGAFLSEAVDQLGLGDRIGVWVERAEDVGRRPAQRGATEVVLARGFGAPAVVAECAAPLLVIGGRLIVSDPPAGGIGRDRWPDEKLAILGLRVIRRSADRPAFTVLEQFRACPERYPRRVGVPGKRPLF